MPIVETLTFKSKVTPFPSITNLTVDASEFQLEIHLTAIAQGQSTVEAFGIWTVDEPQPSLTAEQIIAGNKQDDTAADLSFGPEVVATSSVVTLTPDVSSLGGGTVRLFVVVRNDVSALSGISDDSYTRVLGKIFVSTPLAVDGDPYAGGVLTLTPPVFDSEDTPITETPTITLNGADVSGDVTANEYTVPTGNETNDFVYSVLASNGVGPDVTESETVTITDVPPVEFGELTAIGAAATNIDEADGTYGEFDVASGLITPNTSPLTTGTQTVGSTTVEVEAGVASASTAIEARAALIAAEPTGGITVKLRDGNYSSPRSTSGFLIGMNFSSETIVTAYNKAGCILTGNAWVEENTNLTIRGMTFNKTGDNITLYGPNSSVKFEDNLITGPFLDPNGQYELEENQVTSSDYARGLTGNASQGGNSDISIINNEFRYCLDPIRPGNTSGDWVVSGNLIKDYYSDAMGFSRGADSITIEDNVFNGSISNAFDWPYPVAGQGPHSDAIQFLSGDWTNTVVNINRNVFLFPYTRASPQVMLLQGTYDVINLKGNLIAGKENARGIEVGPSDNAFVVGNTAVLHGNFSGNSAVIKTSSISVSSTNVVKNNIADLFLVDDEATFTNNIQAGPAGSTIAYDTLFQGTDFAPTTRAEALAEFAMLANGPLDADDSGGPSVGDIGAVGTGYVTWSSTVPGNDGSLDASYE